MHQYVALERQVLLFLGGSEMALSKILDVRWLGVPFSPHPEERPFLQRAELQHDEEVEIQAAVLDNRETERFFGIPLARKGIQPVWLKIANHGVGHYRLRLASIDPNYYPPLEAAFVNHFKFSRRILEFGLLAWLLFLPLIFVLPFKILGARRANRRMDAFFVEHSIGWGLIQPGGELAGFVFTSLDEGTKQFSVKLLGVSGAKDFSFAIPIPGLKVDHRDKSLEAIDDSKGTIDCDEMELRKRLAELPRSTTNHRGSVEGDPLNLVVIGDFDTILTGFGARWDETETISLKSCGRTIRAFLRGSRYRYSPVSPLFVAGRSQDFALQKVRETINERLHLRLWITPLRFMGKPVWIGQVSRDIGVRFTLKTWNLTTHKVDPDVDDARDYVLDDLLESGRVARVGYVPGVGAAAQATPRHNLTGDPYFTDGMRAVAIFSETRTNATILNWAGKVTLN
jgi:LssY C-terminus